MIARHAKNFTWNPGCSSNSPPLKHGIKFPTPWKTLIIKFPPPRDGKGVKCPGYARGGGHVEASIWPVHKRYPPDWQGQSSCSPNRKNASLSTDPPPLSKIGEGASVIHRRLSCTGITLQKFFRRPKFPWLMFHVIPVLKMSLDASYFYRAVERVRHFKNRFNLYRARKMDTESH